MKCAIIFVIFMIHLKSSFGQPVESGVYAYQDTDGNRYSGTYNVKNGRAIDDQGKELNLPFQPVPFAPMPFDFDSFFPEFFRNLENSLEEIFESNREVQKKAFEAATKAFEVTSNESGHVPNLIPRASFDSLGDGSANSAYAAGFVSPFETSQIAMINPENPNMKNVNVRKFHTGSNPGVFGVSSVASSSSTNVNGREVSNRFSETTVNRNGEVTKYTVHS